MSATDELRRQLDERGVKYDDNDSDIDCGWTDTRKTYFDFCLCGLDMRVTAIESIDVDGTSMLEMDFDHYFTPAQAIEATLGRGTCHDSNERFNAWQCSECGATLLLMFDDYDEPSYSVNGVADVPNYCPNCGAKVEEVGE